ncbi:sulfur globule protein CV3 domain protein [Necator americanus]|uniref:Sulfur globule protein CV3 domain protein n=1 Tax=Necator americanus TaxID=51031 RepID=W2SWR6_NECAM|nr:sulfur globule protein CV3 domain protein [Necator americanus]ETN74209.1 sulfur globule protein CV3 domain protein [Necator americanus]
MIEKDDLPQYIDEVVEVPTDVLPLFENLRLDGLIRAKRQWGGFWRPWYSYWARPWIWGYRPWSYYYRPYGVGPWGWGRPWYGFGPWRH